MRSPENVLESLKSKACNKSYKYERLYRNLYNPQFYLLAYQRIQAKPGNMTAGTDGKTIDGMGMARINTLIGKMRDFSYQPNPARRTYIPKSNGKMHPLGIASFDDKLIQEVVRLILESIYEPTFSDCSHGFRINKSCHTALKYVQKYFTGTKWFVEGDIKGCFDNVDHHVLIAILRKRIADEHFIGLLWKFLKAGYMEDWNYHNAYSGTPQGSIISPILANIYMNELDSYMAEYAEKFNCGNRRKINPAFKKKLDVCRGKEQRLKRNLSKMSEEEKEGLIAEIRGLYNYYRLANNVTVLNNFYYVMRYSMLKTFAGKYRTRISKIIRKYRQGKDFVVEYPKKNGKVGKVLFYNNGFCRNTKVESGNPDIVARVVENYGRNSLIKRLQANKCEWCGAENVPLEIHHVRKLKDLSGRKQWEIAMIGRRRKTMALCIDCHDKLHAGKLD